MIPSPGLGNSIASFDLGLHGYAGAGIQGSILVILLCGDAVPAFEGSQ